MSNKEYKQMIIAVGIFPSKEMVNAVKEKHKNMVTKAMIMAAFKAVSPKTTKTT